MGCLGTILLWSGIYKMVSHGIITEAQAIWLFCLILVVMLLRKRKK